MLEIFEKKQNRIEEILRFDKENGVPSVFFFGMGRALGMVYSQEKAAPYIEYVLKEGFDAGVHGAEFRDIEKMRYEHDSFARISGKENFGIRMHYLRADEDTIRKLSEIGYSFDCSGYDNTKIDFVHPYKVGNLWEFPLQIMDSAFLTSGDSRKSREDTIRVIAEAQASGIPCLTILFHDIHFDGKKYPADKDWYEWLIGYLKAEEFTFVTYSDAIRELEAEGNQSP